MMTRRCRWGLVALALLALASPVIAASEPEAIFSDEEARGLIKNALSGFWGKAKLPSGETVEPQSEKERTTLPIAEKEARRVLEASVLAGLAMGCELEWREYYLAFMQYERRASWNDKQIAFIGVLFGAGQESIRSAVQGQCTEELRTKVRDMLRESIQALRQKISGE